jgi:hypothetical protein
VTRIAAEDPTAVADPTAVVVHIEAAPWVILSVPTLALTSAPIAVVVQLAAAPSAILAVPTLALSAAVVQLAAAPWVILAVQKPAHGAVRILAPTVVQPSAVAHSAAAEFQYQRGFSRASPLPPASLA